MAKRKRKTQDNDKLDNGKGGAVEDPLKDEGYHGPTLAKHIINHLKSNLVTGEISGIIAVDDISIVAHKIQNTFSSAYTQNAVKDSVFGFFLGQQKDDSDSQLTLGSVDSLKFNSQLKYNKLVNDVRKSL
ncbi:11481_t:CDS:2 [Ambispora leptoticha]|uniref:11481_t:CDS:1 n=1 Tax=Ambispora leptoticha TaxID=144679 RepID=A0A9N9EBS0_9GLOM|nr:11481_t:CDS:2 [Ambispora leptoticha]